MLTHLIAMEPAAEVEVQAVQIGPAAASAIRRNTSCSMDSEIKKGSAFR